MTVLNTDVRSCPRTACFLPCARTGCRCAPCGCPECLARRKLAGAPAGPRARFWPPWTRAAAAAWVEGEALARSARNGPHSPPPDDFHEVERPTPAEPSAEDWAALDTLFDPDQGAP